MPVNRVQAIDILLVENSPQDIELTIRGPRSLSELKDQFYE